MLKKDIEIDGKLVPFRASATIPRLYRAQFKRDIFKDLLKLERSIQSNDEESSELPIDDLEMFENVAYIMAKHADPKQPGTPEDWLDQFDTFSIYSILPQILDLWNLNTYTESESKKKQDQAAGK
ncbi:hypothetical protein [Lacrimispora saccharolytica]|uniref:Uncharacterized protein n=1 Tax=Lacrimispora saccharolytica (strain ATCC 35040 / DSM 2544 / NRCC 2533 / WM1) TaxID=610130 RepID=D9R5G9_LACSW|nr:hypothetical protein [Lacrimispora saccharolytica]ADL03375.1 conserved hypothetical protein [[Clostridium] saccharolyticum WM1]QRV18467.1 hypothetical protein I6K70_13020 [Lacrimispora saccharolytica]